MSLYDRTISPADDAVTEGVAKWARRARSKTASDSTAKKANWRMHHGTAAGEHRNWFGKKPGGHVVGGAWGGPSAAHADQAARKASHKSQRGVPTKAKH